MKNLIYNILVVIFFLSIISVIGALIGLIWGVDAELVYKVFLTALIILAASGLAVLWGAN